MSATTMILGSKVGGYKKQENVYVFTSEVFFVVFIGCAVCATSLPDIIKTLLLKVCGGRYG
jgi:hypothetical protein